MLHDVRLLFRDLIDLSPAEREQVYRERRVGAELRAEVESLLSFDSVHTNGVTNLVAGAAGELLWSMGVPDLGHCGPYRLIRMIGSGGMGMVCLAQRTDGEIQQQVAVKLLRHGHRPSWRDRFLRERQLLASLQHPSIVHVIDAGHTEDGRPFLVMEYVEGLPIDAYVSGIDVAGRLRLFLKVCEGVSHAHRRLIIHRDLKPSNILVDTSGQPKLLDFGIARLLDETGDVTQTVERVLTPSYASPEQLAGTAQTTATDIYSLGAVLYKLLTGVSPRENAPDPEKTEIIPPSRVNPEVPKDVDFVLRKALRKEPDERYISVDGFAGDVRAVLDWRPVQARSGDVWYRTRRFLRRFWLPVTAVILVLASLSIGLYIANRERAIAEHRFGEVRRLANKLLDIDTQVAQLPGGSKIRQLIVDTSLEYLQRLAAGIHMDPDLALEVGTAYMRVARVQGVNISPNLGQTDRADQTEQKAQALIDSVLDSQPANRTALLRSAQIAHDRMILSGVKNHDDEALTFARKSAAQLDQYVQTGNLNEKSDRLEAQQVIITHINVANRHLAANQPDEAVRLIQRAIDIAGATNWPAQAGAALMIVASIHRSKGELDEALQAIRESVRRLEPAPGETRTGRLQPFALALIREGQILGEHDAISLGRADEAVDYLERALKIAEDSARRDPNDASSRTRFATAATHVAGILRNTKPGPALELYDRALEHLAAAKDNAGARLTEVSTLAASTYPLERLGRSMEARKRLDTAFERLRALKLYPAQQIVLGSEIDDAIRALADYEASTGNVRRGAELYRQLLDQILAAKPKPETSLADAVELSNLYRSAASLHRRAALPDPASALKAKRLELWKAWSSKFPGNAFIRRQLEAARLP